MLRVRFTRVQGLGAKPTGGEQGRTIGKTQRRLLYSVGSMSLVLNATGD